MPIKRRLIGNGRRIDSAGERRAVGKYLVILLSLLSDISKIKSASIVAVLLRGAPPANIFNEINPPVAPGGGLI